MKIMVTVDNDVDSSLVNSFIAGDDNAISVLFGKYKTKIYNYINLVVKSSVIADDIFQDVYLKVSQSLRNGKYTDNGKFLSWVLRIAHNQIIDHYRILKQRKNYSLEDAKVAYDTEQAVEVASIEDKMIGDQIKVDIRRLVDALPVEQREVVIMRHYLNMSFKDIADHTGVSINTALGRMRYALINLRKMITDRGLYMEMPSLS